MCYRDEFGRSALKDVGVNTGELQIWGAHKLRSLGIGVWLRPLKQDPSPYVLPR